MSKQLQVYVDSQVDLISPYKVKSDALLADAELQEVSDAKTVKEAAAIRKSITAHKKLVADARKDITRQFDEVKKQFIKAEKDILAPAEKAQEIIQDKILEYEAEEEKRRAAEEARVNGILKGFNVNVEALETPEEVDLQLGLIKQHNDSLDAADQKLPEIRLAFAEAKSALLEKQDELLLGSETDEAEVGETLAEKDDASEELMRAEAAAAKATPKVGVRTKTRFEIVNAVLVPRELCEPSEKLIREFVKKAGVEVEIPGVKVWEERGF